MPVTSRSLLANIRCVPGAVRPNDSRTDESRVSKTKFRQVISFPVGQMLGSGLSLSSERNTTKNVEQAEEAVRLAKARLDAGAGTQLDVLNAQVQLTTAQSTRLQALFGYNSSLAEFDRSIGLQTRYTEEFEDVAPHATKTRTYYTGSDVNATGDRKPSALRPGPVTTTTTRTTTTTSGK